MTLDLLCWNFAVARLQQVLQGLQARPCVRLQEVRVPAEATWQSSHGYATYFCERIRKETGVAISVRQEILRRHSVDIIDNEKHFMKISLGSGRTRRSTAVVYVPPDGTRTTTPRR